MMKTYSARIFCGEQPWSLWVIRRLWHTIIRAPITYVKYGILQYREFKRSIDRTKQNIFLLEVPEFGNLGDQAILLAERNFFSTYFKGVNVVECSINLFRSVPLKIARLVLPTDTVCIHGGGFLGGIYPDAEERFQKILRTFHSNKVVVFPQTFSFEKTPGWDARLAESQLAYERHPNLVLFIRDGSIEFVRANILKKEKCVKGAPDIVLSLDKSGTSNTPKGVLCCFREDKEKKLSNFDVSALYEALKRKRLPILMTDTDVGKKFCTALRELIVDQKLNEFRNAQLVITDRLHGMIFSVITGTPCIALNNTSGKIEGVYRRWLVDFSNIKFVSTIEEAIAGLDEMMLMGKQPYNPSIFNMFWEKLRDTILVEKN